MDSPPLVEERWRGGTGGRPAFSRGSGRAGDGVAGGTGSNTPRIASQHARVGQAVSGRRHPRFTRRPCADGPARDSDRHPALHRTGTKLLGLLDGQTGQIEHLGTRKRNRTPRHAMLPAEASHLEEVEPGCAKVPGPDYIRGGGGRTAYWTRRGSGAYAVWRRRSGLPWRQHNQAPAGDMGSEESRAHIEWAAAIALATAPQAAGLVHVQCQCGADGGADHDRGVGPSTPADDVHSTV